MALARWLVVMTTAVVVAVGAMALAAAQLRPEPEPCLDNIQLRPKANTMCIAPETPNTTVFGAGAAGASVIVVGFLLYRRHAAGRADR